MATFTLTELRKKFGRIETFVGKLSRGDPFQTKNGKPFYANTVLVLGANGKESGRYTPRSDAEVTKAIQFLRNGAMASNTVLIGIQGNDESFIPITQLQITGEFGFQGRGYVASRESSLIQTVRRKLAVAIAQNRGPIVLMVNSVRYSDICDVVAYQGKDKFTHADMEFIDRWGNSIVFVGNEKREISEEESGQILSSSDSLRKLIPFLQRQYEHGLESGDNFYRKISSDDKETVLKFLYGISYNGTKNYSPFNVSMLHNGQFSIVKSTSSTYRLQGDVLENGDMVYGSNSPVILIDYSPGSNDFGIQNAKIRLDRLDGKGNKEI